MSDFDELKDRYNALVAEAERLAEFADVADLKIEEMEQENDNLTAYIETLEIALAQAQGTHCEE